MLEAVLGQPEGVAYLSRVVEGSFCLPLLLVGPQGVGRRLSVIEAAKAVFGADQHGALDRGHHPDFHLVRVEDDKDIKVETIRDLVEETHSLPSWASIKIFVIDGADRLTIAAANALLKVLEEPPSKVRFFLLSEQLETVMPTIRSRCAVVSYRRLPEALVLEKLLKITDDETKARVCARFGEGSLGKSLRCCVSGQLVSRDEMSSILSHASRKDLSALFSAVDQVDDLSLGVTFLVQLLHDILLVNLAPEKVVHLDILDTLKRLATQVDASVVHQLLCDLRRVRERAVAPINLSFHVKSALASVCC
jgi:DNA polymerase III subunit delta'